MRIFKGGSMKRRLDRCLFSILSIALLVLAGIWTRNPSLLVVKAEGTGTNVEVQLSETGKQKVQIAGGVIATTLDRIEFKEHYLVIRGKEPDKRLWVLNVDEVRVITVLH
jgi:hypothetical protein